MGRSTGMSGVVLDPQKVLDALHRKLLTQRELALRTGISQTTVGRMVHGLPVNRQKAAQVIRVLIEIPDVDGMGEYLRCG